MLKRVLKPSKNIYWKFVLHPFNDKHTIKNTKRHGKGCRIREDNLLRLCFKYENQQEQ